MAYHAAEWNLYSIGVELCNRGDALKEPNYYDSGRFGPKRDVTPCKINGNTIQAFDYTHGADTTRSRGCAASSLRLLPNLPAEYPQSSPGEPDVGHAAGRARSSASATPATSATTT